MNKLIISNLLLVLAKPNFEVPFLRLPIWVVASESTGQTVYRIKDCCLLLPAKGHYNSLLGLQKQDECQSRTEHLCAFPLKVYTGGMCKWQQRFYSDLVSVSTHWSAWFCHHPKKQCLKMCTILIVRSRKTISLVLSVSLLFRSCHGTDQIFCCCCWSPLANQRWRPPWFVWCPPTEHHFSLKPRSSNHHFIHCYIVDLFHRGLSWSSRVKGNVTKEFFN